MVRLCHDRQSVERELVGLERPQGLIGELVFQGARFSQKIIFSKREKTTRRAKAVRMVRRAACRATSCQRLAGSGQNPGTIIPMTRTSPAKTTARMMR